MTEARRWQVRRERELREELDGRTDVKKAISRLRELGSGRGFETRRDLLTGGLRLTRGMSPEIADCVQHCRRVLGYERPVEVYVRPDPMFQAGVVRSESGPLLVVLSSRLLEVFTPGELCFVVGHELGHAALDHFGIPMPNVAALEEMGVPYVPRPVSLKLYAWSRAAELSADRLGLMCARDPDSAASGFFKLASGMSSPRVKPDLESYARQVESLASAPLAREKLRDDDDTLDCFSTHPYSPVRVRAVYAFSRSRAYLEALGRPTDGALDDETLERVVNADLALMDPGYLEEKNEESDTLRRLLYSAGVVVAGANGVITDSEREALRSLLGNDTAPTMEHVETARKDLVPRMAAAMQDVPLVKRAQLMQHLALIAAADGNVDDLEMAELSRIAAGLGVEMRVVTQTLNAASAPMD